MTAHNRGKGEAIAWLRAHANYAGNECLLWPFSRNYNGHGAFGYCGKGYRAHRYMCELAHGPAPTPEHETAHSCGRGHDGCINPRHLSWKTRAENQADRYIHNRKPHNGRSLYKLTAEDAEQIKTMQGKKTVTEIAAMYGVSRGAIRQVFIGQTWSKPRRVFGQKDVEAIKAAYSSKTLRELAEEYGVSQSVIWRITSGRTFTNTPHF